MAIFNGGYPVTYPQTGYQQMTMPNYQMSQMGQQIPQTTQNVPIQTMNSTIVWVKHRKEAEDYLVAPNNSVVFMDEAMTHLYMKSADQFGRPSFSAKLLTDDVPETQSEPQRTAESVDPNKYLTKEEFSIWVDDTLEKRLSELKGRQNQRNNNRKDEKRDGNV